jgi:hypothetical protein
MTFLATFFTGASPASFKASPKISSRAASKSSSTSACTGLVDEYNRLTAGEIVVAKVGAPGNRQVLVFNSGLALLVVKARATISLADLEGDRSDRKACDMIRASNTDVGLRNMENGCRE